MAETSIWTMTHITFDTETGEWTLKAEKIGPPINPNPRLYATAPTFAEAIARFEAETRRGARLDEEPEMVDEEATSRKASVRSRSRTRPRRNRDS